MCQTRKNLFMDKPVSLLLTLCFGLIISAYAQPRNSAIPSDKDITITGSVIDKETNDPLQYATVSFFSKRTNKIVNGSITDDKGAFRIQIPKGLYNIIFEYMSYKTITLSNKELNSNINLGAIGLEIDYESLDEVEIVAERTTVEIKLDKKIYNVGKDLTVSGGSVSDVLDNVPSVSVDAEGSVALRGNDNVRILINGKPSSLVGLNSADALQQLPAEAIEKVEVITSPSARYEAEGTAGILNIILRRSKLQGLNGSVTANVGHPDAAGISGNINYRTGDLNFFNTTSYRYREFVGRWYNNVDYFDINTPDLDEKRNWTNINNGINTNTGIEWYITDATSITTSVVYNNNNSKNNSVNNLVYTDNNTGETTRTLRLDPEDGDRENIQYALNFVNDFKKTDHKITFDFQYEDSKNDRFSLINVNGTDTDIVTTLEDRERVLLQSDYVLPLGKDSQIELGYRGDFSDTTTDYTVEILNEDTGLFEINTDLTNLFNFKQHIQAAYFQFGSKINKFSYLLGLRYENTKNILDQPTTGDFKKKNLHGLFPTANLNFEFSEDESITLGYNRRLRRPRGFMLNPFPSRSSITNVFQGNPDLNPTYTDRYEIGYLNRFGHFTLSSAVYYSTSDNVITFASRETGEIVTIDGEEFPVIERGPINVASDSRRGLELNLSYSPTRKWRINTDFNMFKIIREGFYNGIDLGADNLTWSLRLTNKVTLPYKIDWQTNMNYRAPREDAQNNREARFSSNMSFSKDFFKEKASLALNVRDVLNSNINKNQITGDNFTAIQEIQFRGGRTYNLSFTYRFNQKKKQQREGDFGGGDVEM